MSTLKVQVQDTTADGDIFCDASCYCIANKYSLYTILKISNIADSLLILKIGARNRNWKYYNEVK